MDVENDAKIMPWEILYAAALDERFNDGLLEHDWYALWEEELQVLKTVNNTFIYPQNSIRKKMKVEDTISEYIGSVPSTPVRGGKRMTRQKLASQVKQPLANIGIPASPRTPVTIKQSLPFSSDSPWTPQTGDTDIVVDQTGNENTKVEELSSDSEESSYDPRKQYITLRKIPDFGIRSYTGCERNKNGTRATRPNVGIGRRVTPILIEVKLYLAIKNDHDSEGSRLNASLKMTDASQDLLAQVEFLFSKYSTHEKQSAVIAIAASGPFWCWCQFKNVNGKLVENMMPKKVRNSDTPPLYSQRYELGQPSSNIMFGRICEWIEKFLLDPTAVEPDKIKEPKA